MSSQNSSADKSEQPTAHKLRKTREQGQVVRSRDLATAVGTIITLKLLVLLLPGYLEDFRALFLLGFASLGEEGALEDAWSTLFGHTMVLLLKMLAPLGLVPLAGVLGALYPGGWVVTTKHWMPKLERLSPAKNLGKLVTRRHAFDFLASVAKAAAVGSVLWWSVRGGTADFVALQALSFGEAVAAGASLLLDAVLAMCAVLLVFAVIDVPAQAFFFRQNLRMTKQEVKEEHKNNEGRPEVKQRVRQLQRQMARRSVRQAVPTADVVIANPEHYAVALKYDERRAEAPYVVAKGVDEMALYIRAIAAQHQIETLVLPPLARAIYNTSQVQQQIPMALYQAVAQVLHYVLQLQAFRDGRRKAQPSMPTALEVPAHLSEVQPSP